jgi:hypothetical protein
VLVKKTRCSSRFILNAITKKYLEFLLQNIFLPSVQSVSLVIWLHDSRTEVLTLLRFIRVLSYFLGAHVHTLAGFLHPEQTLFFMGLPHFLHGEHPHV